MRRNALEHEMLAQPVRSLQYMLRRLSGIHQFLPELAVDGIFGEETLEAVMLFQRELCPPVTGVVDWRTWSTLRAQWLEAERQLAEPRAVRIFPGEGCSVELWTGREFMVIPQAMFQVLSRHLNGITTHLPDGLHGLSSADNVRWLQRAAGVKETGVMDAVTWDLLSRLYEIFVVKDLKEEREKMIRGWG